MMWGDGHGMSGAGVVWIVVMIAVLVLIVVGIVLLVRAYAGRGTGVDVSPAQGAPPAGGAPTGVAQVSETPLQILEQRYARGEIDRDEFLQRRADLGGPSV